jgi:hypothetical protein
MNSTTYYQGKDGSLVSLDDALRNQNTSGRPLKTFVGFNTGNRTFSILLTLFELQEFTEVANDQSNSPFIAQRKLDMDHATAIGKYILKGLLSTVYRKYINQGKEIPEKLTELIEMLGKQPYLSIPPIVASFRNCERNGTNLGVIPLKVVDGETACYKIFLNHGDVFWVIDGQHRRKGVQLVFDYLDYVITHRRYPTKGPLVGSKEKKDLTFDEIKIWSDCLEMSKACTVSVEVHLGLGQDEERQLFHDLNNLQRKVEKSLALQFDNSNPVNRFIREVLLDEVFHNEGFTIHDKDKINWQDEDNGLTRKDLVAINAILFLNKSNINNAQPAAVNGKEDVAKAFWETILKIPGITNTSPRQKTIAAQPVVLKALAKLTYDFFFGKNPDWVNGENQALLMEGIPTIDFSHVNPLWRYYTLTPRQVVEFNLQSLAEYLPTDSEGNRDLGNYDSNNEFRFGAKHNDIYPIIGDMLRWSLGLPKRKKEPVQLSVQSMN